MDGAPARTGVSVQFYGQPDKPTMLEAVQWVMHALAESDRLPVMAWRDSSAAMVYFADSSWTGMGRVPCGVVDAIASLMWVEPDQPVPDGWPSRRRVRIELPAGEPDQVILTESGPVWSKYMCAYTHGHFSLTTEDGVLNADKDSLYVVVWSNGPRVWRPWGLFVFGGTLESPHASFAAQPTSAAMRTSQLKIERAIGSASGQLAFDVALVQPGPASMELFDVQGRRISAREIDGLTSLEQRVSFEGRRIPAGVYWARLAQGKQQVTSRVLVVP